MKTLFVAFLILMGTYSNAFASGCDYSCWSSDVHIIQESRWGFQDYFKLIGQQNSSSITMVVKQDASVGAHFPNPITFSGYEQRGPLHPRLVNRLLDLNESYAGTVIKADVEIKVTDYMGRVVVVHSGQYRLEVFFETGESVTLYFPSLLDIVNSEDGSINYDKVLPLFFSK